MPLNRVHGAGGKNQGLEAENTMLKRHKKAILPFKDHSGCGIVGFINEDGKRSSGQYILKAIANMHDRGNGLGGGIAAYGIYPQMRDHYCIHIMYDDMEAKQEAELIIGRWCTIFGDETIPTRPHPMIRTRPILHRYFVNVKPEGAGALLRRHRGRGHGGSGYAHKRPRARSLRVFQRQGHGPCSRAWATPRT